MVTKQQVQDDNLTRRWVVVSKSGLSDYNVYVGDSKTWAKQNLEPRKKSTFFKPTHKNFSFFCSAATKSSLAERSAVTAMQSQLEKKRKKIYRKKKGRDVSRSQQKKHRENKTTVS